jgi:hypothetical protein
MAPGNNQSHRGSKATRKTTTTSEDAGRVPTRNTPPEPFPTEDSPGHCNFQPIGSFDAAVERFADSDDPAVTFRQIWDSAIDIGRRNSSKEGVEELTEGHDIGFREGRLLGIEEGLERGKVLGKQEAVNGFEKALKSERKRGYQIGFGDGQDDQKAKQKQNNVPAVSATAQAQAATNPPAKSPENDARHVGTATAASSTSNDATSQPTPFEHSNNGVQRQLREARLEGWKTGLEEGQRREKKKGEEDEMKSEEKVEEGGVHVERDEENQQRTAGGHGVGLCLTMAAHMCALFRNAALLDEVGVQTDQGATTWTNDSTQVPPKTEETAAQTDSATERWCAALQTEPPDDERPHSPKIERPATTTNVYGRDVSETEKTAVQAHSTPTPSSPAPKTAKRSDEPPPSTKNGRTTTRSPSPAPPAQPSPTKEETQPKHEPRPRIPPRTTPFAPQRDVSPSATSPRHQQCSHLSPVPRAHRRTEGHLYRY